MPYDSNGNATITRNRAVTGQTVQAAQVNTPFDDVQSMLSQVLLRSGVAPMTGPLNMNGFKATGAADGVVSTDLATVGQLQNASPIGSVVSYAGATAPSQWLFCFGQAVSRTTYASLFSVIGVSFGVGDGATTFNLPDCRGRVEVGKDDMGGSDAGRMSFFGSLAKVIGGVFGAASHVLTVGQMPSHGHGINDPGHDHDQDGESGQTTGASSGNVRGVFPLNKKTSASQTGISVQSSGNNEAHTNTQPSIVFNKIIKVL